MSILILLAGALGLAALYLFYRRALRLEENRQALQIAIEFAHRDWSAK